MVTTEMTELKSEIRLAVMDAIEKVGIEVFLSTSLFASNEKQYQRKAA